jgi:hypothetical protein
MKKPANRTKGNPESEGIPVDSPNAPIEDTDAGDSSVLSKSYVTAMIRQYRAQANRHFAACAGRELGYRFDLGLRRRHDQRSCALRWLTGCW